MKKKLWLACCYQSLVHRLLHKGRFSVETVNFMFFVLVILSGVSLVR